MANSNRNIFGSLLTMMVTILIILTILGIVGIAVIILSLTAGA